MKVCLDRQGKKAEIKMAYAKGNVQGPLKSELFQ